MPSFDIVSEVDIQEIDNAVNQARKEILSRYDFKGSKSEIQWDRKAITIVADDDYKLNAIKDILQSKVHRRGIDIRALKFEDPQQATGMTWRQPVSIVQGLDKEVAKKVTKIIKDSGIKVQPAIQGDLVRVTSKSIDLLQECIALVRGATLEVAIQITNMRS